MPAPSVSDQESVDAESSVKVDHADESTSLSVETHNDSVLSVEQFEQVLAYQDYQCSVSLVTCFGIYLILGVLLVRFFFERLR